MPINLPVIQPATQARKGVFARGPEEAAESLRDRTLELGAKGEWIVHREIGRASCRERG